LHLSASQQTLCGLLGLDMVDNLEVATVFHRVDETSREWAVVRGKYGDGKILRIRVDRETEENELNNGNPNIIANETVAPHLNEFLCV
jgi:hypothetical protein